MTFCESPIESLVRQVFGASLADEAKRSRAWFTEQEARGGRLTRGVPGCDLQLQQNWLGDRWAWWPRGVCEGKRIGLASSRLGRVLEQKVEWFRTLRAACAKLDPQHETLFTATSTTTARFVEQSARLFGLRVLRAEVADDARTVADWIREIQAKEILDEPFDEVLLSPPVTEEPQLVANDTPARDRALVCLSEQLVVLHLRKQGNLHRLIETRLADPRFPSGTTRLALGPRLVSRTLARGLMAAGGVGWLLLPPLEAKEPRAITSPTVTQSQAAIIALPTASEAQHFLTHCTRRRDAPWPNQTEAAYLNDLILGTPAADHSALAALINIVCSQRLIASAAANRGGHAVVSFTAVPLSELARLRTFRPHRGRWDFEPYGISISRNWLEQRAVRPVIYGDEATWNKLATADQPFFQKSESEASAQSVVMDWTQEQEWRGLGDFDLTTLPNNAAIVFVSNQEEAVQLAAFSRWPVTVLPQTKE